jgi:FkbM family methyltransferase
MSARSGASRLKLLFDNLRLLSRRSLETGGKLIPLESFATMKRGELEQRSRALVNTIPLGDGVMLSRVLGRFKMFLRAEDEGFAAHVMMDGVWEGWLTRFMAQRVKPGMHVVDVGANHGYYSLLFAALAGPTGKVAAIEPEPRTAALLKRSVRMNGFADRTLICTDAAGAIEGRRVLLVSPRFEPKNARVLASGEIEEDYEGFFVRTTRLDTLLASWPRVDFIKIDVEGQEDAVVEGMMEILKRDRPMLVLEFNVGRCAKPEYLLTALAGLYSGFRTIDSQGRLSSVTRETLLDRSRIEDWLLYFEPTPLA